MVSSDKPLVFIRYKYNSWNILYLNPTERGGITKPGNHYLSKYPGNLSYVAIWNVIFSINNV